MVFAIQMQNDIFSYYLSSLVVLESQFLVRSRTENTKNCVLLTEEPLFLHTKNI